MRAEVGVKQLPSRDQAYFRQVVANNLQKLINAHKTQTGISRSYESQLNIREWKIMKGIKQKIESDHLTINKAGKGNQRSA
jgi:3-methyladenine DNA glycosylase AlkC